MNVTFHAISGFATAAILSLKPSENWRSVSALKKYVSGVIIGILVHGILDFLPHNYPLPSKFDVVFAIVLFVLIFFTAQKQNRLLVLVCFSAAILPDLVDLSAGIANRHLGIYVPQFAFKIFPWHWKEYSGSIYDGSHQTESNIYHISVLLICLSLIYAYRKKFFKI